MIGLMKMNRDESVTSVAPTEYAALRIVQTAGPETFEAAFTLVILMLLLKAKPDILSLR